MVNSKMCWISRQGCEGDTKPSVQMRFDFACNRRSTKQEESAQESDLIEIDLWRSKTQLGPIVFAR
jgi:hypothetical protein